MTTTIDNNQNTTHYYRLNPACDKGKEFMDVIARGAAAEREANKLVKECNAVASLPVLYGDFGGIVAFAFKQNVKPDPDVFKDSEQDTPEGYRIYEPNVRIERKVYLYDKMPEESPHTFLFKRQLKPAEVVNIFPRKMIANAMGMELNYLHPIEALRNLNIQKEEIMEYVQEKKTMQQVLAGKMFVSKRDKAMFKFAIEGDKEHSQFLKKLEGCTFGMCDWLHGSEKAVALYRECMVLPVIPQGTLNGIVGLFHAKNRCGFFIHQNWIWIRSSEESHLELSDDWQVVEEDTWLAACEEAKKLYGNKRKKKNEKKTDH